MTALPTDRRELIAEALRKQFNMRLRGIEGGVTIFRDELPAMASYIDALLPVPAQAQAVAEPVVLDVETVARIISRIWIGDDLSYREYLTKAGQLNAELNDAIRAALVAEQHGEK